MKRLLPYSGILLLALSILLLASRLNSRERENFIPRADEISVSPIVRPLVANPNRLLVLSLGQGEINDLAFRQQLTESAQEQLDSGKWEGLLLTNLDYCLTVTTCPDEYIAQQKQLAVELSQRFSSTPLLFQWIEQDSTEADELNRFYFLAVDGLVVDKDNLERVKTAFQSTFPPAVYDSRQILGL